MCEFLRGHKFSTRLLDRMVTACFVWGETAKLSSQVAAPFCVPTSREFSGIACCRHGGCEPSNRCVLVCQIWFLQTLPPLPVGGFSSHFSFFFDSVSLSRIFFLIFMNSHVSCLQHGILKNRHQTQCHLDFLSSHCPGVWEFRCFFWDVFLFFSTKGAKKCGGSWRGEGGQEQNESKWLCQRQGIVEVHRHACRRCWNLYPDGGETASDWIRACSSRGNSRNSKYVGADAGKWKDKVVGVCSFYSEAWFPQWGEIQE